MATPLTQRNIALCGECLDCLTGNRCRFLIKGKVMRFKLAKPHTAEYWKGYYAAHAEIIQEKRAEIKKAMPLISKIKEKAYAKKYVYEKDKPETCSNCGASGPLEPHHENYNKPLEVTWLCRSCHRKLHRNGL